MRMPGRAGKTGRSATARGARRWRFGLAAAAFALLAVGTALLVAGLGRQEPAPPGPPGGDGTSGTASGRPGTAGKESPARGGPDGRDLPAPLAASDPVRVAIPSLDVSSSLERLGLDARKQMETPRDPAKAGWYRPGPAPGAKGPAVIAGHVTWNGTRAVFFDLAKLKKGDTVVVDRKDGVSATFTVDRVAQYPKDKFPTVDVYRNLDHAGLRLITCGGDYSAADRRYSDNVVVYATLTKTRT
ncbi:class F sortase [Streptomyces sp. NPDC047123]|uniref:class F sortase n=1 Tax=Streptomyces sp. NPDC047123 TaxID=3155622 RepID=UPI0033D79F72